MTIPNQTDYPVINSEYDLTPTESRILFIQSKQLIEYRISQDKAWHASSLENFDISVDTSIPITEKNILEFAYLDDFFSLFYLSKKDKDYLLVICEDILFEQIDNLDNETQDEEIPPPTVIGSVYYDKPSKMWWSYYGFVSEPGGCYKTKEHAARSVVINYFGMNDNDTE